MIKLAFFNLFRRKSRTLLSILMIAVGVLSIIALVSLVDGLFQDVQRATGSLQGIMVLQKGGYGPLSSHLDESYGQKIESIPGVSKVEPVILTPAKTVDGKGAGFDFRGMTRLIGSDFSHETEGTSVSGVQGELVEGRKIRPGERGKVIIGFEVKKNLDKFPGNNIRINGKKYKIVGVYKTGSKQYNQGILMNIDDLRDLIGFPKDKVAFFSVSVIDPAKINRIVELLKFKYGEKLSILNTAQFAESLGETLSTLRLMVFGVAAIAAIVAAVGIINTMLMSVMERFKEIGALKATGWTNFDIIKMILFESFLIGLMGGIAGVVFGLVLAPYMTDITGFRVYVSPALIVQSFLFAVGIGVFAGLYPAWKASHFNPIEALRAE